MTDIELGTPVRYSRVLRRKGTKRSDGGRGEYKAWTPGPVDGEWGDPSKTRDGIVYGLRTYTNGETSWGWGVGEDYEPTWYRPQESLAVALVAYDARRKPDAVLVSDLILPTKGDRK